MRKFVVIMSHQGEDRESVGPYDENFAFEIKQTINAIALSQNNGIEARLQEVTGFLDGDTQ